MSSTDIPDPSTMSASIATIQNTASPSPVASTPSPSISSATTAPSSATRRPPRKSTLTQQQKNNKRQRATQDQLVTLEVEFNKNPTPTATTRERIAQEINMTERSVQIWFQNRRAKIKMLAKKSIETGEGCDSIPESMRQYLAMQFDPSKPGARDPFGRTGGYGPNGAYPNESTPSGKVVIHHFTCRSLTVGSWRRIGQNAMDLVVFYSPEKACMTYYINNDSAGYKIEYPFAYIKNITLESGDQDPQANGAPARPAGLIVELNRPPLFYMDSSNSGGFYQCGDFTEDQQASQILVHHLGGHPKVLSVQLAKLVSLESFQNRMAYGNFAANGPMSPHFIQRPASQPNHFAPAFMGMYAENPVVMNLQAGRGHRRQRSRSVPAAVDFAAMGAPMTTFNMSQGHFGQPDSSIYAPIPQPAHPLAASLRIDTSSGYGFDPRAHPMSATTTASPSEFASPSLFTTGPPGDSTPVAATMGAQFTLPFVSPAVDHSGVTTQAMSPYSNVSHVDPMIANHSPPLTTMSHASQEMYGMGNEHQSTFAEDSMPMNGMFTKHMNFTVPTSLGIESNTFDMPMQTLSGHTSPGLQADYQSMTLENVDPSALAPGS
ncbi:homeobox transcription factor (RfeB) [Aspergillus ochraceoroseus]|uniref:Homeobox transcription factor (RfeB) n=2 Tax=Aspergillus ochraceoroseus TaxID=138278 RepID=A0A0F8V5U2_9EURO|nr:homeobox transcription factor (RfeB) [Aspergillus ochraceoroseus]